MKLTEEVDGRTVTWTERRAGWCVAAAHAAAQQAALDRRLATAAAALRELPLPRQGKKRLSEEELHAAAAAIIAESGVTDLLTYTLRQETTERRVRAYRRSTHTRDHGDDLEADSTAAGGGDYSACPRDGLASLWQLNHTKLSLPRSGGAYRGQYRIEDDWSRLKGQPLGLTPMYLQEEKRIQGLVHLLSLCLRVLTLLEWVVRERLRKEETQLDEVYAGQPGRKTSRPSRGIALANAPADPGR